VHEVIELKGASGVSRISPCHLHFSPCLRWRRWPCAIFVCRAYPITFLRFTCPHSIYFIIIFFLAMQHYVICALGTRARRTCLLFCFPLSLRKGSSCWYAARFLGIRVCCTSVGARPYANVQGAESYEEEGASTVPVGSQVPEIRQEHVSIILSIQIGSLSLTPLSS
jgi:hypothetical protein